MTRPRKSAAERWREVPCSNFGPWQLSVWEWWILQWETAWGDVGELVRCRGRVERHELEPDFLGYALPCQCFRCRAWEAWDKSRVARFTRAARKPRRGR